MYGAVEVFFPSVHAANSGEVIKLVCFESNDLKGVIKAISGIDEHAAINIIGASRYGENNSRAGKGVMVSVSNPLFSGRSYGLALATADKVVRYGKCKGVGRIFATGRLEPTGCGKIDSVEQINEKLQLIQVDINSNDILLFPKACLNEKDTEQTELLERINNKGAKWMAMEFVRDGENIIWPVSINTEKHNKEKVRAGTQIALAMLMVTTVVGGGLVIRYVLDGEDIIPEYTKSTDITELHLSKKTEAATVNEDKMTPVMESMPISTVQY